MLRILGSHKKLCDGFTRRELLQVGGLGLAGLTLADAMALESRAADTDHDRLPSYGKAKSVIFLFLYGGVSQVETFDVKPDAPVEIRGRLGAIPTSIPGYPIGEGLPTIAGMVDRMTVIRSMSHPYPIHGTAFTVTSTPTLVGDMQDNPKHPKHWPFVGSIVDYLDERQTDGTPPQIPRNIGLPFPHSSRRKSPILNAGPYAGYLGSAYDPVWTDFEGEALHTQKYHIGSTISTVKDPYGGIKPDYRFQLSRNGVLPADITLDRLNQRRRLVEQFDRARRDLDSFDQIGAFSRARQLAFSLLAGPAMREALDVSREPETVRERYGMTLFGQSCLLARRLVEAGGRFITVFWDEYGSVNAAWDTHYWHYPRMIEQLLPGLDMAFPALILDLEERGLLDETLVVCTTEHGRTPKLDDGDHPSGRGHGGRNHWSRAYSTVLAGAGISRGKIVGKTDYIAGEVIDNPISPKDILATVYHLLGIDPHTPIQDRSGQPVPIAGKGRVLTEVLA